MALVEARLLRRASRRADRTTIGPLEVNTLLGQAVNILDLAQQAGATGIALATKKRDKS